MIYLYNSATTYIDSRVLKTMMPYLKEKYGNPSSFHNKGKEARDAVEMARKQVAGVLNCAVNEIIFTGGGTEANNLAIQGIIKQVQSSKSKVKSHIITTKIEHPSVLEVCKYLEKEKLAEITYLNVDKYGIIDLKELVKSLRSETVLVSIIYANNEIGVIQDIKKISRVVKKYNNNILLHIDACQASGYLMMDVKKLGVDMMTINSSKVYGPKGIGALFIKRGVKIKPIMFGGHQEDSLRPGTENVAGIVGFGSAIELLCEADYKNEILKVGELRDYFIGELFKRIPKIRLNGHMVKRLSSNVNVSILDIEGEALILRLNEKGVYCSTGSACASGSLEPSYVIMALGVPYEVAHGSLRFTFGKKTTKKEIDYVLKVLPKIVADLRAISPVKIKKS
ncbi:MAG: cysteine desulfurase family protein [Patescibacteria group bacterium]